MLLTSLRTHAAAAAGEALVFDGVANSAVATNALRVTGTTNVAVKGDLTAHSGTFTNFTAELPVVADAGKKLQTTNAAGFRGLIGAPASATTISAGTGMSGGGDLSANRTLTWAPATQVASFSLFDGANASRAVTIDLSGTDPVLTFTSGTFTLTGTMIADEFRTGTAGTGALVLGDSDNSHTFRLQANPTTTTSVNERQVAAPGRGFAVYDIDSTTNNFKAIIPYQIDVTVVAPNDLADSERDALWVWENRSGLSFVVQGWAFKSDTDDTTLNIEEVDNDGANNATVDAVEIATNGTGMFYASDTTITAATIENLHVIVLDFDDTDTPGQVKGTIYGYFIVP